MKITKTTIILMAILLAPLVTRAEQMVRLITSHITNQNITGPTRTVACYAQNPGNTEVTVTGRLINVTGGPNEEVSYMVHPTGSPIGFGGARW